MTTTLPGADFRYGTILVGGHELLYAEAGPSTSTSIVSLPGSAGLEMSRAKDVLARDLHVIEINPPGWGGRGELTAPMTSAELAAILFDAARMLCDRPFVLLGTSAGGSNALQVAARAPDHVLGIVLEGSMAPSTPADRRGRMSGTDGASSTVSDTYPLTIDPSAYPRPVPDPRKPWATEEYIERQMEHRFAWFRWLRTDYHPDLAMEAVTRAGIPVLAMIGADDELLYPSTQDTIRAALPAAEVILVPRGLHDLQNSATRAFVGHLQRFVATVAPPPTDRSPGYPPR